MTVPTEPMPFKTWADRACVDWPGELQAQAYRAWQGMIKADNTEREKFEADWLLWRGKRSNGIL